MHNGFLCGTVTMHSMGRSGAATLATEITRTTWTRFFDDSEPVHALVAETRGQLVGMAHYLFHRSTTHI
jgi:hypothetical protein